MHVLQAPSSLGIKVSTEIAAGHLERLTVPPEHHVFLRVTWNPTHAGNLHETLQFLWHQEQLHVLLVGKATAPAPSALNHAAIKRSASDITSTPVKASLCLPETPTGQKVIKSQRVGGISPGHPTFEAAMRNSTTATPSRQKAESTPGPSRYAQQAASDRAAAPAFEARLQEMADSPNPAVPERPRVRLKRAPGTVPLRSLRLSVNQQAEPVKLCGPITKQGLAKAMGIAAAGTNIQAKATKGFSFFRSGCVTACFAVWVHGSALPLLTCIHTKHYEHYGLWAKYCPGGDQCILPFTCSCWCIVKGWPFWHPSLLQYQLLSWQQTRLPLVQLVISSIALQVCTGCNLHA